MATETLTLNSKQGEVLNAALEAATQPAALARSDSCEIANESYRDFRQSWKRLNNLVYALAFAATFFLIGGIVLVAVGSDTRAAGIVAFVGTVVSGVGARWVARERTQAKNDKLAAAKVVREYCDDAAQKLDPSDLELITPR